MIIIPSNASNAIILKDQLQDSTHSYREVNLYGKSIFITDRNSGGEMFSGSSSIVLKSGLYSKKMKSEKTLVEVGDLKIGGDRLVIAAGPCAVESEDQISEIAKNVKKLGADMLRGGAFKPRTSPYSFQGLGKQGIQLLKSASESYNLPTVSEIMEPNDYGLFEHNIDLLQVGSRNSQNFALLKFLGQQRKPVLLKNGMGNSLEEWLNSGEYVLSEGNGNLIMCYRGTRTFEQSIRFSMDTGSIISLKSKTHLPICVDPSHPAGKRDFVESIALSAVASGADMLEIEVHNDPENALSDSEQQLTFEMFENIVKKVRKLEKIVRSDS